MAIVEAGDSPYVQIRIETTREDIGTRTYWAKVDVADYPAVARHTWHATSDGRGVYPSTVLRADGRRRATSMARILLGDPEPGGPTRVDYRNRNGMDNRRSNIRYATQDHLLAKRKPIPDGASQYKGVTWDDEQHKWVAVFRGVKLGRFREERDAARAFDDAAWETWGQDAYLNFPPRPRGVPMTGARARLLTFALDQCLDTGDIQADPGAADVLRQAKALVQHWVPQARTWVSGPRLRLQAPDVEPAQVPSRMLATLEGMQETLRRRVGDEAVDEAIEYWQERLSGAQ